MKTLLAAAATLLLTTGCAQALPAAAANSQDAAAADVRTAVESAVTAAKAYGQKHLGHYLDLTRADLRAEGFSPVSGVTVEVFIDHFDVCVHATSSALPADAAWATATATSAAPEAVAGGRCSAAEALQRVTIAG